MEYEWWSNGIFGILLAMRQPRNFQTDRCYHLISRVANRAFNGIRPSAHFLCFAIVFLCAFASIVGGEPTGCPDFEVELPCTGHSSRKSRPVIRAKDFGLSEANEHNAAAINAAIAEAKRVGAARVELAPGTYKCFDGGRGTTAQPDRSNIVIDGFTDFKKPRGSHRLAR